MIPSLAHMKNAEKLHMFHTLYISCNCYSKRELSKLFAYWKILHAFVGLFICRLLIFFKINFSKILSGIQSECQTVWIQIRSHVLSGLIWVQTVCKGYQQTTLEGKELTTLVDCLCFRFILESIGLFKLMLNIPVNNFF